LAENQVKLIISAVDNTKSAFDSINRQLNSLSSQVAIAAGKFLVIQKAVEEVAQAIISAFKPAYEAVEQYNQSVIKIAAMMTSLAGAQGVSDIPRFYKEATEYAQWLVEELEKIDAKTIASAQDLMLMTEEMAKQGVFLKDNKEELEAFTNIANAVAVISQGSAAKEIQLRQEIRALLQGQVDAHSQLASQLNAMVGGTLKQKVELWKQEGTIIQNIGNLLKGYSEASKDLEGTWGAIGSTLQTLKNQIMRMGFREAYIEINNFLKSILEFLRENAEIIASGIHKGWLAVKGVLESIWSILKPFAPIFEVILELVGKIANGLGLIVYVILPPLTQKISNILKGMVEWVLLVRNLANVFWKLLTLDFEGAKKAASEVAKNFRQAGKYTAEAFAGGLGDEIAKRFSEWERKGSKTKKSPIAAEAIKPIDIEKKKKEKEKDLERYKEAYQEFLATLEMERQEGYQRELAQVEKWEIEKLNKLNEFKKKGIISEKEYQEKRALILQIAGEKRLRITEEYAKKVVDIEKEILKELLNEHEKKIQEIEDWEEERVKKLEELYKQDVISYELFQNLKAKAHEAMLKKKEEAEREYYFKIRQLQLGIELAEIKTAEKSRAITKEESIRRQIENQKELLSLLEEQAQKIAEVGDTEAWLLIQQQIQGVRDNIVDLNEKLRELTGSYIEGLFEAFYEFAEKSNSAFLKAKEAGQNIISSMEKAFSDFFDVTSKGFLDFGALARDILFSIYKELLKILVIHPIVNAVLNNVGGFFKPIGGLVMHEGGLVMHAGGYIPRFHLGVDEVPAILQRGERVLSVEQNKIFEKLAKIINASQPVPAGAEGSIQIVNVIDPNLFNQYLSSSAGKKAILNVISQQASSIKKVLRG
jgi:lambda family phage tail tape measure protein